MNADTAKRHRDPEHTREALLAAAFEEIHLHGFQAASLSRILARAGMTKGALYHHFANKSELGYAVFDEMVAQCMVEMYIRPLETCTDPIECLIAVIRGEVNSLSDEELALGCPLNNLSQEMSPVDETFRQRTEGVLLRMRMAIADALRRGQAAGQVRADIDAEGVATLILATRQGSIALCKSARDPRLIRQAAEAVVPMLEALRA